MAGLKVSATDDGFHVLNSAGECLAFRKTEKAAHNYVAKFERERGKLASKRIHVQQPIKGDHDPNYFMEPGGKALPREKFERWLSHDLLVPVGDALFPGMTQTYEVAE